MKYKNAKNTTLVLCDHCIRTARSRGEKFYISDFENNDRFNTCMWCEAPDDELFEVVLKIPSFVDDNLCTAN